MGLTVLLLVTFMGVVNVFVVTAVAPAMQRDLHAAFGQVQLIMAGYAVAYATGLVAGGRLGDLYGRKRLLLIGLAAFLLASLAGSAAPNASALIAARLAQGLAAAAVLPQVLSIIQVVFAGGEREMAIGLYGVTVGLATIAGQLCGGLLLAAGGAVGWRLVFAANVPLGLLAAGAGIPILRESRAAGPVALDLAGAGLMGAGLLALLVPFLEGPVSGWGPWSGGCLAAAPLLLAAFVCHERRLALRGGSPLLPLRLFAESGFAIGMGAAAIYYAGNAGLFLVLAYYLQSGLGLSALAAGLTFAPSGVGYAVTSLASRQLLALAGTWAPAAGALVMLAALLGIAAMTLAAPGEWLALAPLLGLAGLGWGMVTNPLMITVLARVRRIDAGAAAGALLTVAQAAGALGVAGMGALFVALLGAGPQDPRVHLRPDLFSHAFAGGCVVLAGLATLIFALARRLPS